MPKSPSFTSPRFEMKMFDGEMSRCTICIGCAVHVARVVGVVERLQHLADDEHRERARHVHALLRGDAQQPQRVEPVDVLERGEELAAHLAEVEHLDDLRVGQLRGQLGLVDEHRDEVRVRGQVGQDALDDQDLLEAVRRGDLGAKHLRHAADGKSFQQCVAAKGRGCLRLPLRPHEFSLRL